MFPRFPSWRLVAALAAFLATFAAPARAGRPFLCCDYNGGKVCRVSASGAIEWEYPCKAPQDCWLLPNGNTLFCFATGAIELTPDRKVAWEYKAPANVEVHSCQPLPGGRVMVVECGTSRIVEVDRAGKVAKEIPLRTDPKLGTHEQFRGARRASNGHTFVCFKGERKVVEVDGKGRVVSELKVPGDPHEAVPLPRGGLLVTCGDGHKVLEFDARRRVTWELGENDLPGNPLRLTAGVQRLPNGNTIVCNYLGHGHVGEQPQCIEVTRDKKVVWQFDDHARFKTINQVDALDARGTPVR